MTKQERTLMELLARALYSANVGGLPRQVRALEWHTDIRPGDLVVELSSRSSSTKGTRMGILVKEFEKEFQEEQCEPYFDHVWQIDVEGKLHDWHNASFVRIPASDHQRSLMDGYASRCAVMTCKDCDRVPYGKLWSDKSKQV